MESSEPTGPISHGGALISGVLSGAGFAHGFTLRASDPSAREASDLDLDTVFTVKQVHGAGVVTATGTPASMRGEKADAIVLAQGQTGAIRVADCVPVLVGDAATGRAAAIHAGWRGVVSGVIPAALASMRGKPGDMVAAVGPCIEACCFEVGEEVADQIESAAPVPGVVVRRASVDGRAKAWVDLVTAVRAQLEACGVLPTNVERVGGCTMCDIVLPPQAGGPPMPRFHSFRRDGAGAGRMFGVITAR